MQKIQRFIKTNVSIRSVEGDPSKRVIEGIIPYNKKSVNMGYENDPSFEVVLPTAFNKTLGDNAKVVALFAHDRTKVLGNTKAGTLELESTEDGLICRCILGNTSWANDAWDMISRGDCTQMSFGFWPYQVRTEGNIDYLVSVKLDEVSFCVLDPAYEDTNSKAELRSLNDIKRAFECLSDKDKEEFKNTILINGDISEDKPSEEVEPKESEMLTEEQLDTIADVVVEKVLAKLQEREEEEKTETPEEVPQEEPKDIPEGPKAEESEITSEPVAEEEPTEAPDEEEKQKLLEEVDELINEGEM